MTRAAAKDAFGISLGLGYVKLPIQRHSDLISGKCLSNNAASDPDA